MPIVLIDVGDYVKPLPGRPNRWRGKVELVEVGKHTRDRILHVNWDGIHAQVNLSIYYDYELEALCHNCFKPHQDHGANEKCLFAPTYWKGPTP